jgi:hypothetical protein
MSTEWTPADDEDADAVADGPAAEAAADPEPTTAVETTAAALTREDVLAARVRLLIETVAALRAAQGSPADAESRALGYAVGSGCRALRRLLRVLGQWAADGAA